MVCSDRQTEAHCGRSNRARGRADEEHAATRQHFGKGTTLGTITPKVPL